MCDAIFLLVGTLLGAAIAAITQFMVTRQQISNQYRLAAIEKRMDVHQAAYELCHKLRSNMHKPIAEKKDLQKDCEQWWTKNCIYLCPRSRESLNQLFYQYFLYDPEEKDNTKMKDLIEKFKPTVECLTSELALPPVTQDVILFKSDSAKP